jgi:hypothetical protein
MRLFRAFLLLPVLSLTLSAQTSPQQLATRLAEMQKLDYMVGQWSGTGWIERREGGRLTFAGTETVQRKLNGLALLVEGKFKDNNGAVVHETLAVISYDDKAKTYGFRTYLANGAGGDYVLNLIEGGWQWSIKFPGGHFRYTFKLTDRGEWFEVGEFSQDEKSWRKFFEMTLKKQ